MIRIKKNILNIKNPNTGRYENVPMMSSGNAYDIAVKNGYTGTEAEWLAGLSSDTAVKVIDNAKEYKNIAMLASDNANDSANNALQSVQIAVKAMESAKNSEQNAAQSAKAAANIVSVGVDNTLTTDGAAADAKVVGDKFKELTNTIDELKKLVESLSNN